MFGLLPKNLEFFDCFNTGSQNALRTAELLVEFTNANGVRRLELVGAIKEKEHFGDELTHETLDRLQKTYLTPIDGGDIHALTKEIDDIVDQTVARVLDQFGLEVGSAPRWTGEMEVGTD